MGRAPYGTFSGCITIGAEKNRALTPMYPATAGGIVSMGKNGAKMTVSKGDTATATIRQKRHAPTMRWIPCRRKAQATVECLHHTLLYLVALGSEGSGVSVIHH